MIDIRIYRNAEGIIIGYSVHGHHGEHGNDIVCAGISVLAQTTLKGLGRHLSEKMKLDDIEDDNEWISALKPELEFHVESGDLRVKLKGEPDAVTDALLETMLLGMYDIVDACIKKNDPRGVLIKEELLVD